MSQIIFRNRILTWIGVTVDMDLLEAIDRNHPFNRYIEQLEAIRTVLGKQPDDFYLGLLATDIRDRYSSLVGIALKLPGEQRTETIAVLSAARPILEGKAL